MKKVLLFFTAFMASSSVWAAQCRVDVKNEIHLDGSKVEIHRADGQVAKLQPDNNVVIDGKKVNLNDEQKSQVGQFRQSLNQSVPKVQKMISDGLTLADGIIDDVATSLKAPHAFDNLKQSVKAYSDKIQSRYYKNGEFVFPASSFDNMQKQWTEEFKKAQTLFSSEFLTSAFNTVATSMKQDGGFNLTQLNNTMEELKKKMTKQLNDHKQEVEKKRDELCDSVDDMVEQEQSLHKTIPELKDYQVFTI